MRIDLNLGPQPLPESNRSSTPVSGGPVNSSGGALSGEDQAQLSGSHAQVLALVTQASQLPEVREERIHVLRQAIQSGQYQSSPEKVAGALFAHLIAGSAA
jgi:flagellar biosynthesis anti-sigma factor FlgM